MAKLDKKKVSRIKTKKKLWFKIIAPKLFGNKEIGESYLPAAQNAVGRTLKVNLRELSGSMRDQNVYIGFRITGVDGTNLKTTTTSYELTPAHIKRAVRKNTARLDDVFTFNTKDGKEVLLKSLVITRKKVQRSLRSSIRVQLYDLLKEEIAKVTFDDFLGNIVAFKVQLSLKKKLAKLYPLKEVAIRVLQLKSKKGVKNEELPVVEKNSTPEAEKVLKAPAAEDTESGDSDSSEEPTETPAEA
jgi:small subunit ribosomal protein S3Ae